MEMNNYRNVLSRLEKKDSALGDGGITADEIYTAASIAPVTGEAIAVKELPDDIRTIGELFSQGYDEMDFKKLGLGAAYTAAVTAGLIPVAGALGRMGKGVIKPIIKGAKNTDDLGALSGVTGSAPEFMSTINKITPTGDFQMQINNLAPDGNLFANVQNDFIAKVSPDMSTKDLKNLLRQNLKLSEKNLGADEFKDILNSKGIVDINDINPDDLINNAELLSEISSRNVFKDFNKYIESEGEFTPEFIKKLGEPDEYYSTGFDNLESDFLSIQDKVDAMPDLSNTEKTIEKFKEFLK